MKKRVIRIAVIVIIALLLAWRFWPRSFAKLVPDNIGEGAHFTAYASVSGISNGKSYIHTYTMSDMPKDSFAKILEFLETSKYRRDFRNLLPFDIKRLSSNKDYDGRAVYMYIDFVTEENEYNGSINIAYQSSSQMSVAGVNKFGRRIYHPTNSETLDYLVGYLQANGILQ